MKEMRFMVLIVLSLNIQAIHVAFGNLDDGTEISRLKKIVFQGLLPQIRQKLIKNNDATETSEEKHKISIEENEKYNKKNNSQSNIINRYLDKAKEGEANIKDSINDENTKKTAENQFGQTGGIGNYNNSTLSKIEQTNGMNATVKGKLMNLEDELQTLTREMNGRQADMVSVKNEKSTLQDILKLKANEVKNSLLQELNKVEDELKRHFSHQKAENGRLQHQIMTLKSEKTQLHNQLIALQRRILDLELQVGTDDVKF